MADRTITTRLTVDVSNYESGLQRAARASQGLGEANKKAATESRSAMQRMAQSARENRAEWQQVGGTLVGVGAGVTALMGLVAATGIGYNSLRQTATQGLVAVTGSTEAAAEQMRRLDEYGRNSWLMRDSLIRAQQQMTGFGIETEKVIPYMDALAEAVAATGGSNQDFEELARIMGQVNSSGKITAETLNQFGIRGVDAAQMIGDAMGRTAGQIREDISDGALDAQTALDALADGMTMNFEGSSDLVRQTFRGAVDDVSAAFRDLSATVMAPLVDPEGGGLLTGLLNQVADVMRAFQNLPDPILQAGGALTTVGGFAATAAGGFMLLAPRLVETWDALGKLGRVGGAAQTSLSWMGRNAGPIALGITALATATKIWADNSAAAEQRVGRLTPTLDELGQITRETTDELNRAFTETRELAGVSFDSIFDEAERLGIAFEDLTGYVLGNEDAIARVNAAGEEWKDGADLWERLTLQRASNVENLTYSLDQWAESLTEAEKRELQMAEASEEVDGSVAGMNDSLMAGTDAQGEFGDATADATEDVKSQAEHVRDLMEAQQHLAGVLLTTREAENKLEEAYEAATEAIKENGETLDVTSEKGRANRRALDEIAQATWDLILAADENGASQGELQGIMARSREEFVDTARQMGLTSDEANRLADELNLIPSQVQATVTVAGIENALSRLGVLDSTLNSINGKSVTASVAIRQYGQAAVATGGYMGDFARLASGGQPPRARGLLEGPGTTTSDSIHALLSRKEFVVNAAATDYYGPGFMYALNRMQIPKESLVQQYAGGGTPRHVTQYLPAPRSTATASNLTVYVENPWTGEQVRAVVRAEADGRIGESKRRARIVG